MEIDYSRQLNIIDPVKFNEHNIKIDVIGVGATGSWLTMMLAKMGLNNINVWDGDVVEVHNLPNQLYRIKDIGKPKVEAVKDVVKDFTDIDITTNYGFVDSATQGMGNVVFICTDTMRSRDIIVSNVLRYNGATDLCVETRLAAEAGKIYSFNPSDKEEYTKWKNTTCDDSQGDPSACGLTTTLGSSAAYIASMSVIQMIKWYLQTYEGKPEYKPEMELFTYMMPEFKHLNIQNLGFED